jgi:hypothetical protein
VLLIHPVFAQNSPSPKNIEWKLGSQAYTFKNFTFAETLDKILSIDIL